MNRILFFLVLMLFTGCFETEPEEIGPIEGLKPIYITEEENVVEIQDARVFENLGKIVYSAPYLLVNERFKGIHIVNNADPADPIKIAFIQIPGNTDFTLRGQFLYANHGSALKTFLVGSGETSSGFELFSIQETENIEDLFGAEMDNAVSSLFPPDYLGFFECVDPNAGIIVGWESATLINPACRI